MAFLFCHSENHFETDINPSVAVFSLQAKSLNQKSTLHSCCRSYETQKGYKNIMCNYHCLYLFATMRIEDFLKVLRSFPNENYSRGKLKSNFMTTTNLVPPMQDPLGFATVIQANKVTPESPRFSNVHLLYH